MKKKRLSSGVWKYWTRFVTRPRVWQCCVAGLAAALIVYGVEAIAVRVSTSQDDCAVWWPINGLALGTLLAVRRRHWPWMLGGFIIGLAASESTSPIWLATVDAFCNALEVLVPALVLPRFRTMDKWLSQPGIVVRFVSVAMLAAPAVEALLAPAYSASTRVNSYWYTAMRWGIADMLGIGLFTPLFLALISPETWALFRARSIGKTIALIGLTTGLSYVLFHQGLIRMEFILYPLILMTGMQLGLGGAILSIVLVTVISTQATVTGNGPFAALAGSMSVFRVLELQVFLALLIPMVLPVGVARVRRLTTERTLKRAWDVMETLATVDGLTGIANRRRFDEVLETEWARLAREASALSLLLIDVDHFKSFNDNYGHLTGDSCLRSIADAIASVSRKPNDLVARYGGEEFAVVLPGLDSAAAAQVAERVRSAVHELGIPHESSHARRVTVSIGLASALSGEEIDPSQLIALSDAALYKAKRCGRNQVCISLCPAPAVA